MDNPKNPQSNVLPACIIATGIIIAAAIIAKPELPFTFTPVSTSSVELQFSSQMQSHLTGRHVKIWSGEKTTLKRFAVEGVEYDADKKRYSVRYSLYWNNASRTMSGTSCLLTSTDSKTFSGSCGIGEELIRNGYTSRTTVPVSIQ